MAFLFVLWVRLFDESTTGQLLKPLFIGQYKAHNVFTVPFRQNWSQTKLLNANRIQKIYKIFIFF